MDEVLGEFAMRSTAYKDKHPGSALQDGSLFEGAIADLLVVGQDIPAVRSYFGYPHRIFGTVRKMIDVAFNVDTVAA